MTPTLKRGSLLFPDGLGTDLHQEVAVRIRSQLVALGSAHQDTPGGGVTVGEWRRLARVAARSLGRPVKTAVRGSGVEAFLTDWPATPDERAAQEAFSQNGRAGQDHGLPGRLSRLRNTPIDVPSTIQSTRADRPPTPVERQSGARQRIVETADRLFSSEGIGSVGVDRLVVESGVTKATFYKYFASRHDLDLEYLDRRHDDIRLALDRVIESAPDALTALRHWAEYTAETVAAESFRGSPFLNAAAEHTDPRHPLRLKISTHQAWHSQTLTDLFTKAGATRAEDLAGDFLQLLDGTQASAYVSRPAPAIASLNRGVTRLLQGL